MRLVRRPQRADRLGPRTLSLLRDPEPRTEPIRRYPPAQPAYHPAPVSTGRPPRTHQAAGRGWHMTVNTDVPGVPVDSRLRAAREFIGLKVAYLESEGMGYRIDENEQVLQRGEEPEPGSIMADALREGVTHLLGPRDPWQPSPWNGAA